MYDNRSKGNEKANDRQFCCLLLSLWRRGGCSGNVKRPPQKKLSLIWTARTKKMTFLIKKHDRRSVNMSFVIISKAHGSNMKRTVKEASERREEIINAARKLFQTKEFEKVTMQELLDRLNIVKGSIYHYFPQKRHCWKRLWKILWMKAFPALVGTLLHAPKGSFSCLAEWKSYHQYHLEEYHDY